MSEKLFDEHLPNLEQAGWEPGMPWVPTIDQDVELDMRYRAENMAESARSLSFDPDEVPVDVEEQEKLIRDNIRFLKMEEDYDTRPFSRVISDTLMIIDMYGVLSEEREDASSTTAREAKIILEKAALGSQETNLIDPETLVLASRWAAVEQFMYHHLRCWGYQVTFEDICILTTGAGISDDELNKLLTTPLNQESDALLLANPGLDVAYANQAIIESKMLARAKEANLELTPIHPFSVILNIFGS